MDENTGHGLIQGTVYGPVISRRYGGTVGINPLPSGEKTCNFSCVYCQLGMKRTPLNKAHFPDVMRIRDDLSHFLSTHPDTLKCQYLVISGNGEPTLHPAFPELIDAILGVRQKQASHMKLICFTNGSTLATQEIRQALALVDECALKFDPALECVDLPDAFVETGTIVDHARKMPNLVVQSCLFAGRISNISRDDLEIWTKNLILIRPRRIDLYTLSRETAVTGLEPLRKLQLKNIAAHLIRDFGLFVNVIH